MNNYELPELIQKLCSTILTDKTPLDITKEEATSVIETLVVTKEFRERIRRIKSNRDRIKITHSLRFQKYFETLAHNGIIERMCFDNSSKYAFSGGADGIIKCWNIQEGMLIRSLYGHTNMVSDLCISKDGDILVSVDYQGALNIWCLSKFMILHSIQLNSEAIFCEFIYHSNVYKGGCAVAGKSISNYNIFIILADGTVKTCEFSKSAILSEKENSFMLGESIKAICITDGGRFVICGGWWPFFLIYDTKDLNSILVLENFRIQTLCAAKNSLKFAASSENQICSYTFYCKGSSSMGNFNRKRSGDGYWRKHINTIDSAYFVEWLCYLPSLLLVAACTDDIIRIYEDDQMLLSFEAEAGCVYSHPFKDVFAVVGTRLTIYQIARSNESSEFQDSDSSSENLIFKYNLSSSKDQFKILRSEDKCIRIETVFSEGIYINLNDCQFSDDGRFFITCDDQGVIKAYSIEKPIKVPKEQFFLKDIDRAQTAEQFDATYDMYRQRNNGWARTEYLSTRASVPDNVAIEDFAAASLERDKLNETKFKKLYLSYDSIAPENVGVIEQPIEKPDSSESDDDTCNISEITDSVRTSETSHYSETFIQDESSPMRILRRASLNSNKQVESRQKPSPLLRSISRRALVSSESSNSTLDKSEKSKHSLKPNKKLQRLKKFDKNTPKSTRRLLISDDSGLSEPASNKRRRIVSDGEESPVILRRYRQHSSKPEHPPECIESPRILRKNLSRRSTDTTETWLENENPIRLLRKHSNGNHSEANYCNKGYRKLVASSSSQINDFSSETLSSIRAVSKNDSNSLPASTEKRLLRRDSINQSRLGKSEGRVPRRILRMEYSLQESSTAQNGIDPDFEQELYTFSQNWLISCSIYEDTEVYFSSESYDEFTALEPRIKYNKNTPKTGFHRVSSIKLMNVGKIPYALIGLDNNRNHISVYEYPDSGGILCTKNQYKIKKGDSVKIWHSNSLISGQVSSSTAMAIKIDKSWYLKSSIAIGHRPLGIKRIPCAPHIIKPLFGMDRTGKYNLRTYLNYSIVNTKIENDLYASTSELLFDLKAISNAAIHLGEDLKNASNQIYQQYLHASNYK